MTGTRIRILHVVSGDLWAGAEVQLVALLTELGREPSVQLHAIVLNPGELERRLRGAGVGVTVLDESRLGALAILGGIRRVIRQFAPSVVHTHRLKENVLAGLAARLEDRRPSLRTVHGAPEHRPSWWRLDKQLFRWLDDWAERHWQSVSVAVSDELGQRLRSRQRGVTVEVIHNGIDAGALADLRQRHLARATDSPRRVAFLGRLTPVKRVDLFLRLAQVLVGQQPIAFDIVGDGPLRGELERLTADLGLADHVVFHGFRDDALAVLAQADVLVFTSDHEGTPMAALEALAIGVPVVARAVGGLPEMLVDCAACQLVPGDSPELLAAAVVEALQTSEVPHLPGRYAVSRCASQYLGLYRAMVPVIRSCSVSKPNKTE